MVTGELKAQIDKIWNDFWSGGIANPLDLEPGITLFVGRNGFGKTNIVEAVGYTAHLASHRVTVSLRHDRAGRRVWARGLDLATLQPIGR